MINKNSKWGRHLIPTFDKLTIFCVSYSLIFLFFIDKEFRDFFMSLFNEDFPFRIHLIIITAFLSIGFTYSIYHVISKRKLKPYEKTSMLFFLVFVYFFAGFVGLFPDIIHYSYRRYVFTSIFPVLNWIYGFYLFMLLRANILDENSITDENYPIFLTLINILLLSIIIYLCKYHFELIWPFTFSISVSYLSIFNSFVNYTLKKISGLST